MHSNTLHETLEWNPLLRKYEHTVHVNWEPVAKANYQRRKEIGNGMAFKAEARELAEIPMELMHDPLVRDFLKNPADKSLMRKVFEKYPLVRTSEDTKSNNRIFLPSEVNKVV